MTVTNTHKKHPPDIGLKFSSTMTSFKFGFHCMNTENW